MINRKTCALIMTISMLLLASCGDNDAIAEVAVSNMQNSAREAVKDIGNFSFDFTSEDGATYSCLLTGLKDGTNLSEEEQTEIAENLGGHFVAGSTASLVGESFQPVDAEKFGGKDNSSVSEGTPFGDANLCWAASAANMLVSGGWTDENEDELMSYFTENYFDDGSFQNRGIKFYFNGINIDQEVAEDAGKDSARDAVFIKNEGGDFFSSTQVRNPGIKDGKLVNNAKLNKYAAENLYTQIDTTKTPKSDVESNIVNAIDEGSSVGMALVFYKGESRVGVHALTINGYIKDADGALKALIIADSDNDVDFGKEYMETADATLADREARPNSFNLFLTDTFTHNDVDYITLKDYKYGNPKMKYDNAVVQEVTILKSINAVGVAEKAGTMDSANTPDIIPRSAALGGEETNIQAKAGDEIKVPFIISNLSYKGFKAKDKAVIKCRFIIKKDGNKVDETSFDVKLVTDSYTTGEANCSFSVTNPYTFKEAENYTVDVEVLGITSASGTKLQEAYTSNNLLKDAYMVSIQN